MHLRKRHDEFELSPIMKCLTYTTITMIVIMMFCCIIYAENIHFIVIRAFAHLGQKDAQFDLAQRLFQGKGIPRNSTKAIELFKKAAEQGHPAASYNLAIAHYRGYPTNITRQESNKLIQHAANEGMKEAKEALEIFCQEGSRFCRKDE